MKIDDVSRNGMELRLDKYTTLALVISLVFYPLLYSLDFFSGTFPTLVEGIWESVYFGEEHRANWWFFWGSNFIYHWVPLLFIWFALFKNRENWNSIGLNFRWYLANKYWFIILFVVLIIAAFILPGIYYTELPQKSNTVFFAPVSTTERLFVILMAFTTGFTEEVLFRGFAFTRLKRIVKNSYFILFITIVSFLLIHGQPESIGRSLNYIIAGAVFGIAFITFKFKRLEALILVHFLINASLVIAP